LIDVEPDRAGYGMQDQHAEYQPVGNVARQHGVTWQIVLPASFPRQGFCCVVITSRRCHRDIPWCAFRGGCGAKATSPQTDFLPILIHQAISRQVYLWTTSKPRSRIDNIGLNVLRWS